MKVRFRTLLLAAIALVVIWYFTGGREDIAYREFVRQSELHGTFRPWMLEHWSSHGILFFASVLGIYIVLAIFAVRGISLLMKKFTKARG
jgi:hypothetical protein